METKRFGRNVLTITVIVLGSIFGLSLSTWFPIYEFKVDLPSNSGYEKGFAYQIPLSRNKRHPLNLMIGLPSSVSWIVEPDYITALFEDEIRLGPEMLGYEAVINSGNGRYYIHEQRHIYFSASDNSDPRSNGRSYSLRVIVPRVTLPLVLGLFLLFSLSVFSLFRYRKSVRKQINLIRPINNRVLHSEKTFVIVIVLVAVLVRLLTLLQSLFYLNHLIL